MWHPYELLAFGPFPRRSEMNFESAAKIPKTLAINGGTRGDWFRVIMEKFVVNFRMEHWLMNADVVRINDGLIQRRRSAPTKDLVFPLGKKGSKLMSAILKELSAQEKMICIYLLDSHRNEIFFLGKATKKAQLKVYSLQTYEPEQTEGLPTSVAETTIDPNDLKNHDPLTTLPVWSRAVLFKKCVYGDRWEFRKVNFSAHLTGISGARTSKRSRKARVNSSESDSSSEEGSEEGSEDDN